MLAICRFSYEFRLNLCSKYTYIKSQLLYVFSRFLGMHFTDILGHLNL